MRESVRDILAGALLLLLAAAIFIYSFSIKVLIPVDIGSGFFPRLVSVLLGIVSLPIIGGGLRRYLGEKGTPFIPPYGNTFGVVATILCMGAYIALLDTLGFLLASILYLLAQFSVLAANTRRSRIRAGVLRLLVPAGVCEIFVYGFDMILPEGSVLL